MRFMTCNICGRNVMANKKGICLVCQMRPSEIENQIKTPETKEEQKEPSKKKE